MIGSESGIFWQVELLSKTSTKRTSRLLILLEYFFPTGLLGHYPLK